MKATKILSVSKRAITVTVPNFTVSTENVSSIDWTDQLKTIQVTNSDGTPCTLDADYGTAGNGYSSLFTLTQSLTDTEGNYDVVVGYKNSTLQTDFLSKYTPTLNRCVATVTTSSYTVTYTAGANGTLTANNITAGSQGFDTGASIKKNSKLLFTAAPDDGFQVSKWTVKNATTGAELTTGFTIGTNSLTLNALNCDLVVTVEFSNETHTVTFGSADTNTGTVTATQFGTTLVSGNTVVGGSSVTFTATPASGYVVKQWSVAKNNGTADVQLNPDGATAYTGATLTLDNIDADTAVTVTFEEAGDPFQVTYSAVKDESGSLVAANDVVSFTADGLTDGTAVKGSTVKLTATVTPGTAIQEWQVSTNGTDWTTVAGSTLEYTIYSLQSDTQVRAVVKTSTAVYKVNYSIDGGDDAKQLTAATNGGNIATGTDCTAYSSVAFTYVESANYELVRWDVTGTQGTESSNGKTHTYTISSLDAATTVTAVVQKKPQITFTQPDSALGTIAVTGTIEGAENSNIASNKWVDCGTEITVTVTPTANYVVTGITAKTTTGGSVVASNTSNDTVKASGELTLTFKPTENVTISATFAEKPTVTVDAVSNGTVTFTGTKSGQQVTEASTDKHVDFGSSLTVTLIPNTGYEVDNPNSTWTAVPNSDNYTYTVTNVQANQTIAPTWSAIPQYAVTYSVVDTNGPTVDGGTNGSLSASADRKGMEDAAYKIDSLASGGNVYRDSTVTFTAAPESGFRVKEWRVNGVVQKADGITDISSTLKLENLNADATVTVQFTQMGNCITIEAGENGTITGAMAGTVDQIQNIASGFGLAAGASVEITAQPATGYEVEKWTVNGEEVPGETGSTYTYTAQADSAGAVIAVTFRQIEYPVTWGGTNGTVGVEGLTSGADIRGGTEVTFAATPDEGYVVTGWTVNGVAQDGQTGETFTWTVPNGKAADPEVTNYEIEAIFGRGSYEVTVIQPDHAAITADPDVTEAITSGTKVTFTVAPEDGYIVIGWTVDGVTANTSSTTHTVTINKNTTVTAVIVPAEYNVTYSGSSGGTVTATGYEASPASVPYGGSIIFTATPDAYYHVKEWQVDGVAVPNTANQNTYTLSDVTVEHTVTAVFAGAVTYEVGYEVDGGNGALGATANGTALTLSSGQTAAVPGNSRLVFTAAPGSSMVAKWSVSTNNGASYTEVTCENMASLGVTMSHYLANVLTLEKLESNFMVKVEFEQYVGYDIPQTLTDYYTVTNITRTPDDTAPDTQIRRNGDVTFTVAPVLGKELTALTIGGVDCLAEPSEGSVTAVKNGDGSYTITVKNVTADLNPTITATEKTYTVTFEQPANGGTLTVKKADGSVVNSGDAIPAGTELTVTAAPNSDYVLGTLTVDGTAFTSGSTFTLTADVTIAATFKLRIVSDTNGGSSTGHAVIISDAEHGSVTANPESAASGQTVTLVAVPDKGYELGSLTVIDSEGSELALSELGGNSFTFTMPNSAVQVQASFIKSVCDGGVTCPSHRFTDVNTSLWYHEAIDYVVENNIMNGTGDTTFSLYTNTTRGMVMTMLARMNGVDTTGSSPWYKTGMEWAVASGVSDGTNPGKDISRQEVATMLYRYAQLKGYDTTQRASLDTFTDGNQTASWAKEAMEWAVAYGVFQGDNNHLLNPKDPATRVEVAQIFMNYMENIVK